MKPLDAQYYADLLGKPYELHARGPEKYDCVGILLEIQRRMGRPVQNYESRAGIVPVALEDWDEVATPQPGDGILLRGISPRWHVATVLDASLMFTSREIVGACIERYDTPLWRNRIKGFYRWKNQQ